MSTSDMTTSGDAREALVRRWMARAGSPSVPDPRPEPIPVEPPGPALVEIWQEVLGRDDISPDDDYFVLGGDSIAAVAVVSRSMAAGVALTTHDLFELRTVRAIVHAQLTVAPERRVPGVRPVRSGLDLTPLQRGMLFQSLADPSGRTQVVQISALLTGDIDTGALAAACRAVVARHPTLRTSVHWDGNDCWRVVHEEVAVPVRVVDLRLPDGADRGATPADRLDGEIAEGFDLGVAPLLRFSLVHLEDGALRFALTHHHLVLDGWSQQVVVRDLLAIYDGEALPASSGDPTAAHLNWLNGHDQDAAMARWRTILAGFVPALVSRAVSRAVSGDVVGAGHEHRQAVTQVVDLGDVADSAARLGVTAATVVYGAWSVVVAGLARTHDVAIGVTLAGRAAASEASEQVGMFIATLPLRTRLDVTHGVAAWIRRLQQDRVELDSLQHCGLTDIARCAPDPLGASGARSLFDTIAVVENFPEHVTDGTRSRRVTVTDVVGSVWEGYPLVLEARLGRNHSALLRADGTLFSDRHVATILSALEAVVRCMSRAGTTTVGDLLRTAHDHLAPVDGSGRAGPRGARRQVADPAPSPEARP